MSSRPETAAASLFACILLSGCGVVRSNPGAVQKQFEAVIPLHSTAVQVADYLDHRKLPHSRLHHDETFGNVIEAEVSTPSRHDLVDPSYDVFFVFDDQSRLIEYKVGFLGYIGL